MRYDENNPYYSWHYNIGHAEWDVDFVMFVAVVFAFAILMFW